MTEKEIKEVKEKGRSLETVARKAHWRDVCNEYLMEFCKKHEYAYEPDMWIGNDPGGIIEVCDMFVNLDEIRYDIDHEIPESYFAKWYWKGLEVYELTGQKYMNYPSYCNGAPDEWTEERLEKIRESHRRIEQEKEKLERLINEHKENDV